jgi:NADPH2:quinone reductase
MRPAVEASSMEAIEVTDFGDRDSLTTTEREVPEPDSGEVRIAVEAVGVNFADIMQRRGNYPGGPQPPYVPGMEGAGTIDAVGEGVDREVGERVIAMTNEAYAEFSTASVDALFDIPSGMDFEAAAGFPVQFLTAHNTLFEWGGLMEGESVLIHAAAGGVGTAATQLASRAGATVFGTASSQEKLDLAAELGCDQPIDYTETNFATAVNDYTDGAGVDLVLDGVGGETTQRSLSCLTGFGRMTVYGAASGEPGRPDTGTLLFNNHSLLGYHLGQAIERTPQRVLGAVPELTEALAAGDLEVIVGETFALENTGEAHAHVEERESTGKVVLVP